MEIFHIEGESGPVFFRNLTTLSGVPVVFDPIARAFVRQSDDTPPCMNRAQIGCNWIAAPGKDRCISCALTKTIPDLDEGDNIALWAEAEAAKRRALCGLMRWGYFLPTDSVDPPRFRFLSERVMGRNVRVVMGHKSGVVTINIQEADPAIREFRRQQMEERFRTMTSHIRHELGHALFARLTGLDGFLEGFRALFGDETQPYAPALEAYYAAGPKPDFAQNHLTAYASAHPHEDWAETFAHFLNLIDMLDSACAAGLTHYGPGVYNDDDAQRVLLAAADMGIALNHINRSMGLSDIYPFVFTSTTLEKLCFVHQWVRRAA
jgi:hypothetical protein